MFITSILGHRRGRGKRGFNFTMSRPGLYALYSMLLMNPGLVGHLGLTFIPIYVYLNGPKLKSIRWVGSSLKDLKSFPKTVQRHIGQALYAAQCDEEYPTVKALKGYGGRTVLEIVAHDGTGTYRAIYTVRFR